MDFTLTEVQSTLRDLAVSLAAEATSPEQVAEAERSESRLDSRFWDAVVDTGLAGVTTPAPFGGLGFGPIEAAIVAEGLGRAASLTPWRDHCVAAYVLARYAPDAAARYLDKAEMVTGIITAAIEENGRAVASERTEHGWALKGDVCGVPWADVADRVLVPFRLPVGGQAVAIVSPDQPGVTMSFHSVTNHERQAILCLDGPQIRDEDVLLGDAPIESARALGRTLIAAEIVGACERAIELTVDYANVREQFGKPLATNQAYSQRLADASITLDAMRVTAMKAAWALEHFGRAEAEVRVAAWWGSDGGSKIVHTTQHLHGAMGADIGYPVHRHYIAVKQRANTLGSASAHLAALGAAIAAEGET